MPKNYEMYPVWQDIDKELQRLYLARFGEQPMEPGVPLGGLMVGTLLRQGIITFQDVKDWHEASELFNESRSAIVESVADGLLERLRKL